MKTREPFSKKKKDFESYITQINWDWLIFKGLSILGGVLLIVLIVALIWIPL